MASAVERVRLSGHGAARRSFICELLCPRCRARLCEVGYKLRWNLLATGFYALDVGRGFARSATSSAGTFWQRVSMPSMSGEALRGLQRRVARGDFTPRAPTERNVTVSRHSALLT